MRLIFAGTPEVALPCLDALAASDHELVGVITRPDAPAGRGKRLRPSPVAERASELGVPVRKPSHPREPELAEWLREAEVDCVPVVAYGALVPERVIAIPRHGWVNLHFSLLPRWRGAAPVQHALLAGDAETGATTFALVAELDAGPVYASSSTPIGAEDNAGEVLDRLANEGAELLLTTLSMITEGRSPRPQPEGGITLAPKITSADTLIDWSGAAIQADRLIRASTPAPGAWTRFRGERFKISQARPIDPDTDLGAPEPGRLRPSRTSVVVDTGAGALELLTVQPAGKRPMAAADWARGAAIANGETFDAG